MEKILNSEELELLHGQGLCEDIRNKLSAPLSLADVVLLYFENTELSEKDRGEYIEIIKSTAKISRESIAHITSSLDHALSLPDEKIPDLIRGNKKK